MAENLIKVETLLDIIVGKPLQQVQDVLTEILTAFSLETAVGAQLDIIAESVGAVKRSSGESDNSYRYEVKLQIILNNSSGVDADFYAALTLLTNDSEAYYENVYPKEVDVYAEFDEIFTEKIRTALNRVLESGSRVGIIRKRIYTEKQFCLSELDGAVLPNSGGLYDETDPSTAGKLTTSY